MCVMNAGRENLYWVLRTGLPRGADGMFIRGISKAHAPYVLRGVFNSPIGVISTSTSSKIPAVQRILSLCLHLTQSCYNLLNTSS